MRSCLSPLALACAAAGWMIQPGTLALGDEPSRAAEPSSLPPPAPAAAPARTAGAVESKPASPSENPAPAPTFAAELEKHFAAWDADHDGFLSLPEAYRAIADPETRDTAAAAAVAVRQSLLRTKAEHVSLADAAKDPGAEKSFAWASRRLQGATHALYAKEAPHPESLRQGKLGDCFCLAGLRAVLQRDPAAVAAMISTQPDGTYRVRLGAREFAVPAVTDGEIILGASVGDGLWPIVYEKAVGLLRTKPAERESTPFASVTRGGSAGSMMATLTDHPITRWSCKPWRDAAATPDKQAALLADLRRHLQSAFAEHRLVTTGTSAKPATGAVPGVTYNHGYTVLGYDPARDEVRLWNPHGDSFKPKGDPGLAHGYPRARGEWTLPLTDAVQILAGFAFEKLPASAANPTTTSAAGAIRIAPEASPQTTESGQ